MSSLRIEVPLSQNLANELIEFLTGIFGSPPDIQMETLLGNENQHNRNLLYFSRRDRSLAGTCLLTISRTYPILGGLGEVATDPSSRRTGIATELCEQAVSDFQETGGQALFLGTINPSAARVYHRLGWRKLPGAGIMVNTTSRESPEEFLNDYFNYMGHTTSPDHPHRKPSEELNREEITIHQGSPEFRIPIIPLIHTPHDNQILDANARIFSRRYADPGGCMSLYPKYEGIARNGRGAWFVAYTNTERVVGISTVSLQQSGSCQVDGFTHQLFSECMEDLISTAMKWGAGSGASKVQATVSIEDEDKQTFMESLGFRKDKAGDDFEVGGRVVASIRMERSTSGL